ncbi:MAG TPA: histidine kinase, partial [Phycisphaerales bacterium]|nr:histidine kinase [Phycisphaerales bacterium]
CGACGYETCREHAVAIHKGLAECEMCLPYTIDKLNEAVAELEESHKELASTQEALMQSERLASMGQLAAGIAHEVNNPLGVVLMYAHLMLDGLEEDCQQKEDARMIVEQADRCKKIVAGLLHFARQNKVLREPTDLADLLEKAVRAVVKPRNITLAVNHNLANPAADLDANQILQVLTNIISNAYAAMPDGGTLTITTSDTDDAVTIAVSDTGTGISQDHRKKIFEPFFTTKQIGRGTGLGLAVSYGIVKMHHGQITVDSNDNADAGPTGTTFTIQLPRKEEG